MASHQNRSTTEDMEDHVEDTLDQIIEQQNNVPTKRNVRGATRGISVQKRNGPTEKLNIVIHPTRNRIVGENAKDFKTEACVIVKQHAPIQYARWKEIPADIKRKLWLGMKQKFNLEEEAKTKRAVYDQLNRQYRSYRHKLHAYYQKKKKEEGQILDKPPHGINREDWKMLVNHFESDSFKRISLRNKENRAKLTMAHSCGTKSIAQYCYEERDCETGDEPTRTKAWKLSRYNEEKKEWADEASANIYAELLRLQVEPNEDGGEPMSEDEAFVKVLGEEKSTRLRACGDGMKPPSKRGEKINVELQKDNEDLRKKNEDLSSRLESLETKFKSQEENFQSQMTAFFKQFQANTQASGNL